MKKWGILLIFAVALSACQKTKPDIEQVVRKPSDQHGSVIDVNPMLPDAVWSLITLSDQQQKENNLDLATSTLLRALRISPDSPLVQQHLAELYLAEGKYKEALQWSDKVASLGPQFGQLCQRANRVVSLAAEMLGNVMKQEQALESVEGCVRKEIPRY